MISDWQIALIGSLSGVVLVTLIDIVKNALSTLRKSKKAAAAIYVEISTNQVLIEKGFDSVHSLKSAFLGMLESGRFDGHPSLANRGQVIADEIRNIFLSDVLSFSTCLSVPLNSLYSYYNALRVDLANISELFRKFYLQDQTVGGQDVVDALGRYIREVEASLLIGDQVRAELLHHYKVDSLNSSFFHAEANQRIENALSRMGQISEIKIDDIVASTNLKRIMVFSFFIHNPRFLRLRLGVYQRKRAAAL